MGVRGQLPGSVGRDSSLGGHPRRDIDLAILEAR